MIDAYTFSLRVPNTVKHEIDAILETGAYDNAGDIVADAVHVLVAARRDLRIALAVKRYQTEEVSLGKAAEIASVDIETMKELLHARGVKRNTHESLSAMRRIAHESLAATGRTAK